MNPFFAKPSLKGLMLVALLLMTSLAPTVAQNPYDSYPLEIVQGLRDALQQQLVVGAPNYDHVKEQLDELDEVIARRKGLKQPSPTLDAGAESWLIGTWILDNNGDIKVAGWAPHDGFEIEFRKESNGVNCYVTRVNSWGNEFFTPGQQIARSITTNSSWPEVWHATAKGDVWRYGKRQWEFEDLAFIWHKASNTLRPNSLWGYRFVQGPGNNAKPPGEALEKATTAVEKPAVEPGPKSKVVKLQFLDSKGNPQTHLSPGADFTIQATYNGPNSDVPKLVLRYHQGEARIQMSKAGPKTFRTRALRVGVDVPAVSEVPIKATLESVNAEATIVSDVFVWNSRGSTDWHGNSGGKSNWDTELSRAHSTTPRKPNHQVRIPAGGSVRLATKTAIQKLTGSGGLALSSSLSAQAVSLKDLDLSGFLRVKDQLRLEGSVQLGPGAKLEAGKAVFSEKTSVEVSDGVVLSGSRLSTKGQLSVSGKVTANLEEWRDSGRIVLKDGAALLGTGQLYHDGDLSASDSEIGLFSNRSVKSRIRVSERLRLSGGGVHESGAFGGGGRLEFGGEHRFKNPFVFGNPWSQLNGKLTFERGVKSSESIRLEQGELEYQDFFTVSKGLQQKAGHRLISDAGKLTISEDAEVSLKGLLSLGEQSRFVNDGKLTLSGVSRVVKANGRFSNVGEVVVEKGITLELQKLDELVSVQGQMKRPLAEAQSGPGNLVISEGTWDVAGRVRWAKGRTGGVLVGIGETAELVLRKGGSFGGLNKVKKVNFWNTGVLTVCKGVNLDLGTYFQTGHGVLVIEKGATVSCGASVKDQKQFEVFMLSQGSARIDGALEVYDAYSDKLDDRRIRISSLKVTGSGTINGKPLSRFLNN